MSTIRRTPLTALAYASLAALAGGAIAYAVESSTERDQLPPVSYAPVEQGGVDTQQSADFAIGQVMRGLTPGLLSDVHALDTPPGEERAGWWLSGNATLSSGTEMEAIWEFDLLQGAVSESIATTGNLSSGVVGYKLTIAGTKGSEVVTGGSGDVAADQHFSSADLSDAQLISSAVDTLRKYGLDARDVTVLHAMDPALRVIATISDFNALSGKVELLRSALVGDPIAVEGLYLLILDSNGEAVIEASTAYRSGAGRLWIRPNLKIDLGTSHG